MASAATGLLWRIAQALSFIVFFCEAAPSLVRREHRSAVARPLRRPSAFLQHHVTSKNVRTRLHHRSVSVNSQGHAHHTARAQRRQRRINYERRSSSDRTTEGQRVERRSSSDGSSLKAQSQAYIEHRRSLLGHLRAWLSSRFCMKKCGIALKEWDGVDTSTGVHTSTRICKSECLTSVDNLIQASHAVRPGEERQIQFPAASSAAMQLHDANDKTAYNGMMFAGGVKIRGNTSFVARLCTHNCHVGDPFYDSTVILGELEQDGALGKEGSSSWKWKHAMEHWVPHNDGQMYKGDYVGPEDPRMDVLHDSRFLTVGMNVPTQELGCDNSKIGIHRMFFVPVDNQAEHKTCNIQVPGVDNCKVQKNWASLVPRGSDDVYYIYSIRPLQVIRLQPKSCKAAWVATPEKKEQRHVNFDPRYSVHGGTRYVFGGQVADGDLFWSVGHTPSPEYMPVLVAMLMRNATAADASPHFELLGVSCPIHISHKFTDPVRASAEKWAGFMLVTSSIVDFDPKADVSTITFQVHDRENYQSQLLGVGAWLQTVYKESRSGNVFSCDSLQVS